MKAQGIFLIVIGIILWLLLGRYGVFGVMATIASLALIVWGIVLVLRGARNVTVEQNFHAGCRYSDVAADGSAIAVDIDRKVIKLRERSLEKEYLFSDIRDWEINRVKAAQIILAGRPTFAGGMAVTGENYRQRKDARLSTGLFIRVRDVDHPKWRVGFQKQETLDKWYEIMQQVVNEGAT